MSVGMTFNGLRREGIGRAGVVAVLAAGALAASPALAAASAPTVSSLSPKIGRTSGNTAVQISGSGFTGATAVDFGSTPAKSFKVESSVRITAISPPGTGIVAVTVTTGEGTNEGTAKAQFQYLEPPEFGTCVRLGFGGGSFTAAGCQTPQFSTEGNSEYEWFPAFESSRPVTRPGFTLSAPKGMTLETVGKAQVKCATGSAEGEYTAVKSVTVEALKFAGCASRKLGTCQGSGEAAGVLQTQPLSGTLGITGTKPTASAKKTVGLELAATSGETIAEFSCGEVPVTVRGAVIAGLGVADKMTEKTKWSATQSKGVQKTIRFEGGPEVVLEAKVGMSAGYERAGLKFNATGLNETELEFSTKI
jgi:IPT/TIG domain